MKAQQKVVALSYRAGSSKKDGSNKDRRFASFVVLDMDGNVFDIFQWEDTPHFPKSVSTPCLMECVLEFVPNSDGKISAEVLSVERMSASFDLGKIIESAKIPMEKAQV
jgi:hypothetical protein